MALLAVAIVAVSSLLTSSGGYVRVLEAYWTSDGGRVLSAIQGARVVAHMVVSSPSGYRGYIEFKVRRDNIFLPDTSVAYVRQFYVLEPGERVELTLTFIAERSFIARGYHMEVRWDGGKYVMEAEYPPRLRVSPFGD